jgi:SPP1 gp7 family putative phage head morphogenesis protein
VATARGDLVPDPADCPADLVGDEPAMTVLLERAIGGGESQVSYGSGEKPRYQALARTIQQFYEDLQPPLADLREAVFTATQLPEVEKAEGGPVFRYTAKLRRILDKAITKFLDTVAGPDRTREGYVNGGAQSDQSDGILQQRQIMAYSVGLRRAADLVGTAQTLVPARADPAVREMLDNAFSRLSQNGALRLEMVRDDIHGILVSGSDAGLSPLDVGRQLSKQFDQYSGYEFERLARTESAFASEAGNREQMMEFGVQFVTWLLAAGACPICQAYEGRIIPIEDEDNQPPAHPNCMCSATPYLGGLT